MKIFYSDPLSVPLPKEHRFPMPKYSIMRERLEASDIISLAELRVSESATDEQILQIHAVDYLNRLVEGRMTEKEMRRIGFPWSPGLVERSRRSVGGTIAACRAAMLEGIAINLGGGTHHAYPDHGEGYCVFNDVAVACRAMQAEGRAIRFVILDCDVHQGNGTAAIFADDPSVFTFSVHGEKNFPYHKEHSDLDIALPDSSQDDAYLKAVSLGVKRSLQRSEADLGIYIAGADPFLGDRLGRMAVTKDGLAERDQLVFNLCRKAGLPLAVVMGGGYAQLVEDIVDIHLQTIRIAMQLAPVWFIQTNDSKVM
jgi:acetoin utilization deacetylase AcuC-like enzyme